MRITLSAPFARQPSIGRELLSAAERPLWERGSTSNVFDTDSARDAKGPAHRARSVLTTHGWRAG